LFFADRAAAYLQPGGQVLAKLFAQGGYPPENPNRLGGFSLAVTNRVIWFLIRYVEARDGPPEEAP